MDRRNFLKTLGIATVAPLGLVGKAVSEPTKPVPKPRNLAFCKSRQYGFSRMVTDIRYGVHIPDTYNLPIRVA